MKIRSLAQLQSVERQLSQRLRSLPLENVLWTLRAQKDQFHPFVTAGLAALAVRFCAPPRNNNTEPAIVNGISGLADQAARYLLTEPIVFDSELREKFDNSNPIFLFLRIIASQQPYHVNVLGGLTRPVLLFDEIPRQLANRKDVSSFNITEAFHSITGSNIHDFMRVSFVAHVAAEAHTGFDYRYFEKALSDGVQLPSHDVIRAVLRQISANQREFRKEYFRRKNPDPRFAMYNLNPLHVYPLIRPWGDLPFSSIRGSRMIAPLPDLIVGRLFPGLYYQLFGQFKTKFSVYFGHLFEAYVGRVLKESVSPDKLMSEEQIRASYPSSAGRAPDWVVIHEGRATLFECKATRFTRTALETGDVEAVNKSLQQLLKGFQQLHEFRQKCLAKTPGLEAFNECTDIETIVVTPETLHGVNTEFFREHINGLLQSREIVGLPWRVLAIDELEALQPHVRDGLELREAISILAHKGISEGLEQLERQTGRNASDSFLSAYEDALLTSLGADPTSERQHDPL
jgi:hypothetical protein